MSQKKKSKPIDKAKLAEKAKKKAKMESGITLTYNKELISLYNDKNLTVGIKSLIPYSQAYKANLYMKVHIEE